MAGESSNMNDANITLSDPYMLSDSDHPGMSLTSSKFNGTNHLGWSRTVKMALGAKQKLCFVDGSLPKPVITSSEYQRWVRCDYMVTCWLLNSLETNLSDAFLYAQSSAELWKEITERYGHVSGQQVYQVHKDLNEVAQGEMTVADYFTRLKKCWDELSTLNGGLTCTCGQLNMCGCGLIERMTEIENRNRLMQFLLKLRNEFDGARSQILAMDPLPSVNKAYYIIQQVETQQNITRHVFEPTAFMANVPGQRGQSTIKRDLNNGRHGDRKYCRYCHSEGHVFEQCFECIGYPDWFKARKGRKPGRMAANVQFDADEGFQHDNPLELLAESGGKRSLNSGLPKQEVNADLISAVFQEVVKILQKPNTGYESSELARASTNFAGPYN